MDHFEKVEKLRERVDVSYEEAQKTLQECDWNMLDALLKLESQGKVMKGSDSSKKGSGGGNPSFDENSSTSGSQEESAFSRFWSKFCELVKKGFTNTLVMRRNEEQVMELPVLIALLLLLACFPIVVILMFVSLFFNFTYTFNGPDLG